MLIGFAGVFFLVQAKSLGLSFMGLLAMCGATHSWWISSVLQTSKPPLVPGSMGSVSEMLCRGAVLLAISLAVGENISWPLDTRSLLAWGYLVVFDSVKASVVASKCVASTRHESYLGLSSDRADFWGLTGG